MAWGSLLIAGQKIPPGETRSIRIPVSESYTSVPVYMPITVIRGSKPGPTVSITAAVHGDELIGIEAVRRVISLMEERELGGTLICVPIVNVTAFANQSRNPPDGRDLNRAFPGRARGSPTSRTAHVFFHEVIALCDYGIDLHTAGGGRVNIPHIRSSLESPQALKIAVAFGTRLIVQSAGEPGMLRNAAAKQHIHIVTFEAGEPLRFDLHLADATVRGILNVLAPLDMVEWKGHVPDFQFIAQRMTWIRAERGGILIPNFVPGQLIGRGEEIARNTNPLGKEVNVLKARRNALVVSVRTLPMVNPGDPVAQVVALDDDEWELAEKAFPHSPTRPEVL